MDSISAFMIGEANRGREPMVFDWEKAARLIRDRKPRTASAGLKGDWEWTGGTIYRDGKPVPKDQTYTYLASTWAIPQLELDDETIDCFRMSSQTPGWGSDTYWPPEALGLVIDQEPTNSGSDGPWTEVG